MKKILMCLPSFSDTNGIKTFVMNYYNKFDKNEYEFDFILVNKKKSNKNIIEFLQEDGCKIFEIPEHNVINRVLVTRKFIKKIIKKDNYDIVHVNLIDLYAYAIITESNKNNIKSIIYHVHNPKTIGKLLFISTILNKICIKKATDLVACTTKAGKSMFGKNKFSIIENVIDINKFKFNIQNRSDIRKELGCENDIVIGTIGRLEKQKNPFFMLKVLKELVNKDKRYKLLWIGDGKLKDKFINTIREYNLEENVIHIEKRENINEVYSAMDCFALPSLYEGLGIVFVEAQANGLQVFASQYVPDDIKITENVVFLPIDSIKKWINEIENLKIIEKDFEKREKINNTLELSDYNNKNGNKLADLYSNRGNK